MTISGELRELGSNQRTVRERKDAGDITESDRTAINRIETMFKEAHWKPVGSGRSADVTVLDIWEENTTQPWVIKAEQRRTREQELLGTSLEKELALHEAAYRALETARAANPEKSYGRIPKPLSLLRDETHQWLLMDYLPGDNLFVHTLRAHLLHFETEDDAREEIKTLQKDALLERLLSPTFINTLPARLVAELQDGVIEEIDEQHWRMIALGVNRMTKGPSVILTRNQYDTLRNTIEALHKAGIHHRDLHAGNIQILPDSTIGLMDFGLASLDKDETSEKGRYTVNVGHELEERKVALLPDNDALNHYWEVARKVA